MAITIDWVTGVVSVPKADTTLTGTDPISGREIRSFDTDQFHVDLRIQEDSLEGRTWPVTHDYNSDATFGGATFAPQFILKNSYTVEFEDGTYRVVFTSTNNNIADYSVVNNVSIQPGNSAGLQTVATGSGVLPSDVTDISDAVWAKAVEGTYTAEQVIRIMSAVLAGKSSKVGGVRTFRDIDDLTDRVVASVTDTGDRTAVTLDGT